MEYISSIIFVSIFCLILISLIVLSLLVISKQVDKENDFLNNLDESQKALILDYKKIRNVSFKDFKKKGK